VQPAFSFVESNLQQAGNCGIIKAIIQAISGRKTEEKHEKSACHRDGVTL
jgi:hypothetical protein